MTSDFLRGALTVASAAVGLFFLRFWKLSGERLFALFAIAFWILALESIVLASMDLSDPSEHYVFLMRLLAFGLIIFGVIDKNRPARRD